MKMMLPGRAITKTRLTRIPKAKSDQDPAVFPRLPDLRLADEPLAHEEHAVEQGAFFSGWKNRGIQLHRQRNYEDALAAYEQAIRYNPFDDHAYRCLGEMFTELGMYEVALSTYQRAIEQGCASVWAYLGNMHVLMNLHRYGEALAICEQVLAVAPQHAAAHAYVCKAEILVQLERWREALFAYAQALRLNPRFAAAYNNLGILLSRMQRPEEARRAFQQAIAIEPGDATFLHNLALFDQGSHDSTVGIGSRVGANVVSDPAVLPTQSGTVSSS
jgi:tetratricopeptide (TPR) repeat protein